MTEPRDPQDGEDGFVYFDEDEAKDESRAELERTMAEAEKAVAAVEERHRRHSESGSSHAVLPDSSGVRRDPRLAEMLLQLEEERGRTQAAEEEAGRLREALLRKVADFDNLKRRTEKEKSDFFKFALAEVFRDLLAVLDNFERAMSAVQVTPIAEDFRVGVLMIQKQLEEVLKRYGLTEVPAAGMPFDPNIHEAIAREETDAVAPGTVIDVLQKGFLLGDRLLRPARVKVASASARKDEA